MKRILIYITLFALLPTLFVALRLHSRLAELDAIEARIDNLLQTSYIKERKQALNQEARTLFADADHFYIDKELETMTFLKSEIAQLEALLEEEPALPSREVVQRLNFLKEKNHLTFSEGQVQSFDGVQEWQESFSHPIELDIDDLSTLLSAIEDRAPGRPQMLITHATLERQALESGSEVFTLNLKLIKREFEQ